MAHKTSRSYRGRRSRSRDRDSRNRSGEVGSNVFRPVKTVTRTGLVIQKPDRNQKYDLGDTLPKRSSREKSSFRDKREHSRYVDEEDMSISSSSTGRSPPSERDPLNWGEEESDFRSSSPSPSPGGRYRRGRSRTRSPSARRSRDSSRTELSHSRGDRIRRKSRTRSISKTRYRKEQSPRREERKERRKGKIERSPRKDERRRARTRSISREKYRGTPSRSISRSRRSPRREERREEYDGYGRSRRDRTPRGRSTPRRYSSVTRSQSTKPPTRSRSTRRSRDRLQSVEETPERSRERSRSVEIVNEVKTPRMVHPPEWQRGLPKGRKVDDNKYQRYLNDFAKGDFILGLYPIDETDEQRAADYLKSENRRPDRPTVHKVCMRDYLSNEMAMDENAMADVEDCVDDTLRIEDTLYLRFNNKRGKQTIYSWSINLNKNLPPNATRRKVMTWIPAQSKPKFNKIKAVQYELKKATDENARKKNVRNTFETRIIYDM